MNKKLLIALAVIIVIAGGAYLLMHKSSNNNNSAYNANTSSNSSTRSSTQAAATITYSGSGFSPSHITVKSGDTVAIKNSDTDTMQLDSNPHPVHTDDTDLNVGTVSPGQTKTFTVTKKGTFGFHNHLEPSNTATITIE